MKWIAIFSLFIFFSCRDHSSKALSADQQGLFNLSRDFKSDYRDTTDSRGRERLVVEYELKLQDFLRHKCSYRLEGMKVQLKQFEEDAKGRVYAEFVDGDTAYVFQKVYDSSAEMKADTAYQIVKSIQPGREIAVRFLFAGNVKVSGPGKKSTNSFRIGVIPTGI